MTAYSSLRRDKETLVESRIDKQRPPSFAIIPKRFELDWFGCKFESGPERPFPDLVICIVSLTAFCPDVEESCSGKD